MQIEVSLTHDPIPPTGPGARPALPQMGSWLEFHGVVREQEASQAIVALDYEAYPEMARRQIHRILEELSQIYPCLAVRVIHRVGRIPVGETAIYVGAASPHRREGLALLAAFVDRLKQDVPIWKVRAVPTEAALAVA